MEILGPDKDDVAQSSILTSEADYGITAEFHDSSSVAVLELKIPRSVKLEPYSTGLDTLVTMTIESAKIDQSSGGSHQGPTIGGGGRHRHGGGMQNSGTSSENGTPNNDYPESTQINSGERSSGEKSSSDPISFNLRVHLIQ